MTEAGGSLTDLAGEPRGVDSNSIVASSNPQLQTDPLGLSQVARVADARDCLDNGCARRLTRRLRGDSRQWGAPFKDAAWTPLFPPRPSSPRRAACFRTLRPWRANEGFPPSSPYRARRS